MHPRNSPGLVIYLSQIFVVSDVYGQYFDVGFTVSDGAGRCIRCGNFVRVRAGNNMNFKTILLGTAAVAVMAVPALAQDAPPAPKKHHHHVVAASSGASSIDARIDELEKEVQDLKAQQAAAQTAPADAVSQAQFEALQNQVYEEQAATTTLTKSSWWANTKIGGRIFWDITNIDAKATVAGVKTKSNQDGLNYDIKRAYLIIDHKFNDVWSANITTDVTYDGTTKASQLFLKKAYVQGTFAPWFTVRAGAADLPWVPFVEGIYGYRYVENVLIDRTKFGTSTDWGAHILGTFDLGGPTVGYAVSATNGFGYKLAPIGAGASNPATAPSNTNRGKGIDVEGRVNLNWDGFVAAVGGFTGKQGNDFDGTATVDHHQAERFDGLLAYTTDEFRIGAEYFASSNYGKVTSAATKAVRADGYSGFASWQFDPQWSVFGRYDWVKPTNALTGGKKEKNEYYNLGVSFSPIKQLDFALVYKHDGVDNGAFSDSEFNDLAGSTHGTYNEIGLFGQVNF
jgi:hypothetical protein